MTPRWRWWLFCVALWLHFHVGSGRGWWGRLVGAVLSWSTAVPEWWGEGAKCGEAVPF